MIKRNEGFANLTAGYLFPEVAKRRKAYQASHPDAKIISLGIGNTTEPLSPHICKAMADYAKKEGIDESAALRLICATLKGSAEMLENSGDTPDTLIKKVSSPGGTTLKALEKLEEKDFYQSIIEAMDACTKRADELSK